MVAGTIALAAAAVDVIADADPEVLNAMTESFNSNFILIHMTGMVFLMHMGTGLTGAEPLKQEDLQKIINVPVNIKTMIGGHRIIKSLPAYLQLSACVWNYRFAELDR